MKIQIRKLFVALTIIASVSQVAAQGSAFTYQGRLNDGGARANGPYDLRFAIYDSATNGNQIAAALTNSDVAVSNGLFSVALDFGAGVFDGNARWLEIGIRTNGGGTFTTLAPRQPLLSTPYAIMAGSASNLLGNLPAAQLSGTVALTQLPAAVVVNNETSEVTLNSLRIVGRLILPPIPATVYSGSNLLFRADFYGNFFGGRNAGNLETTGFGNTALGDTALSLNTIGGYNTANGAGALYSNTRGSFNTANASAALGYNVYGNYNTAAGCQALSSNTNGSANVANGYQSLFSNTSGSENVANGSSALYRNLIGWDNTANGCAALYDNTTGSGNTASGASTLRSNTNGNYNTATGERALYRNTSGSFNTAVGLDALSFNVTGSSNTAVGFYALLSNTNGNRDIALGDLAGCYIAGNDNIDIGNPGSPSDNGIIRIGTGQTATYLPGTVYANGVTLTSDRNAKAGFGSVNSETILAKVVALPISEWNFKTDPSYEKHIGPMAQDFHAAFNLNGSDDKHISVLDEGGVALAAIQGLNKRMGDELKAKNAEIHQLQQTVAQLKEVVNKLASKDAGE